MSATSSPTTTSSVNKIPVLKNSLAAAVITAALLLTSSNVLAQTEPKIKIKPPATTVKDTGEMLPYAAGEVLVKFKTDPDLRPANLVEQYVLGQPKIRANRESLNQLSRKFALKAAKKLAGTAVATYQINVTNVQETEAAVTDFQNDPTVEFAEPNYRVQALTTPNDTDYHFQWDLPQIKTEEAWEIAGGGKPEVKVAVLDTGVAYEDFTDPNPARCSSTTGYTVCINAGTVYGKAPDFSGTYFVAGYDFVNNDVHPNDDNGHGTHISGTIAETTNNARAAAGVAYNVSIVPIKVLVADGGGYVSTIVQGIDFAKNNGAKVINFSIAISGDSQAVRDAVIRAKNAGVTIVAAAGNESQRNLQAEVAYPAAYPEVIGVGAVRYDKTRAAYSNYGASLDLVAPGGQVINDELTEFLDQNGDEMPDGILQQTIDPGEPGAVGFDPKKFTAVSGVNPTTQLRCVSCSGFWCNIDLNCGLEQGTSMAAPHIAAAAALLLSQKLTLTPSEIQKILQDTTEDLGPTGRDDEYGYGLVNIQRALQALSNVTPVLPIKATFEKISENANSVGGVTLKTGGALFTTTLNRSGSNFAATILLAGVAAGTYDVIIKGPKHLSRKSAGVTIQAGVNPALDFSTKEILGGDLNGDNQVKLTDVGVLIPKYGTTDPAADINLDGKVNMYDVGFLVNNYGKVGE